jgi:hypothetical protein
VYQEVLQGCELNASEEGVQALREEAQTVRRDYSAVILGAVFCSWAYVWR